MLKRLLLVAALCVLGGHAWAQCAPLPYTLTNGTIADANQVMANFNAVNTCAQGGLPTTPTTATLAALLASNVPNSGIIRLGYAARGDSPSLVYFTETGTCAANARVNDGGSCINTTSGDGNSFYAVFPEGGADIREFGATCGAADASGALNAAAAYWTSTQGRGGIIRVPCPMTVNATVTLSGGVRLMGNGPVYYPGMTNTPGPAVWPPLEGPAINCTNSAVACFSVTGEGVTIDHLNFGNPQTYPAGSFTPTVFPFVISTASNTSWQGLTIQDISFTSTSNAIDLEGTPDYTTYSGSQIRISHVWCNPCLNTGIKIHRIDNPLLIDHVEFTPSWGNNVSSMGSYMRANAIGFDIQYAAAPQFANIDFYVAKSDVQLQNATVTNNFGVLTFAASNMSMTNVNWNQSCQGITMPGGNGTVATLLIVNTGVWGDQSGFQCSKGKPFFSLNSNDINFSLSHAAINFVDTFIAAGCGAGCTPGGGAIVRLDDLDVAAYSEWTAGQNFINAPAGTEVEFGTTVKAAIRPAVGGGKLMGPGPDSTQAYEQIHCIGSGTNPIEGSACVQGTGSNANSTGSIGFYDPSNTQQGYIGLGNATGINYHSAGGAFFTPGSLTNAFSVQANAGKAQINMNPLPTAPISGVGFSFVCVDNAGNLYAKATCP